MSAPTVRPIHADEWERVRALRIRAVRDPAAAVAFVDSLDRAEAYPDEFWRERAAGGSIEAGPDGTARQFVAEAVDGAWVGTATGLLERAGATDFEGRPVPHDGASVVGVWIDPEHRGAGLLADLFRAIAEWAGATRAEGTAGPSTGTAPLRLTVHTDNGRARAAYEKCGFVVVGEPFDGSLGRELEMRRSALGTGTAD